MKHKLNSFLTDMKSFFKEISKKNIGVFASSGAFYIFLSVVPIIMLVCSFIPPSHIHSKELRDILSLFMPESISSFMSAIINEVYISAPAVRFISIIVTLWTASKALASIMRGIEHAGWGTVKYPFIRLRLRAMLYSLIMILIIYILMMSTMFLNLLIRHDLISMHINKLIVAAILSIALTVAYKLIPSVNYPLKKQLPGAISASLCWIIFSYAYSIWLNISDNFGIFGSLGSVIVTLMWMYITLFIILLGAFLNYFIIKNKEQKKKSHQ